MTGQRERRIHSILEFERIFLPRTYRRRQRAKRIKEVGLGIVMAEEALKKLRISPMTPDRELRERIWKQLSSRYCGEVSDTRHQAWKEAIDITLETVGAAPADGVTAQQGKNYVVGWRDMAPAPTPAPPTLTQIMDFLDAAGPDDADTSHWAARAYQEIGAKFNRPAEPAPPIGDTSPIEPFGPLTECEHQTPRYSCSVCNEKRGPWSPPVESVVPTFTGHRLIQLTCNHAEKTDTVLCECGWQQTFISCGAAFDGWLLHYRITVENWPAEPVVLPEREPQVGELSPGNEVWIRSRVIAKNEQRGLLIRVDGVGEPIMLQTWVPPEHFDKLAAAPRAAGGQRETQAINLAMAEGVLDEIRSQFAKRHPVESLFFEQWLTETFGDKQVEGEQK